MTDPHPTDALVDAIENEQHASLREESQRLVRRWYDENVAPLLRRSGYVVSGPDIVVVDHHALKEAEAKLAALERKVLESDIALAQDLARLETKLAAARALHWRRGDYCYTCGGLWPCATARALGTDQGAK